MATDFLYKDTPDGYAVCNVCGKTIYRGGPHGSDALKSHARKHVREGVAIEGHIPSNRSYSGYEIEFYLARDQVD